jgi:hypothetical protein
LAIAQKVLAQAVPSPDLVLLGGFAGSHEIAQRLMVGVGDPDGAEIAASVGACQLLGVAAVGLDAVARHLGHEGRRDDLAVNAEAGKLPVQHVPSGPCLVADPKAARVTELADELADGFRAIGDRPQGPDRVSPFDDRHRDGLCVYIHADKSCYSCHDRLLSRVALRSWPVQLERNLRPGESEPVVPW